MSAKRRIFAEYIFGPKSNGAKNYTKILITKPVGFDEARPTLEASPEYNPARRYVQLQSLPSKAHNIDIITI